MKPNYKKKQHVQFRNIWRYIKTRVRLEVLAFLYNKFELPEAGRQLADAYLVALIGQQIDKFKIPTFVRHENGAFVPKVVPDKPTWFERRKQRAKDMAMMLELIGFTSLDLRKRWKQSEALRLKAEFDECRREYQKFESEEGVNINELFYGTEILKELEKEVEESESAEPELSPFEIAKNKTREQCIEDANKVVEDDRINSERADKEQAIEFILKRISLSKWFREMYNEAIKDIDMPAIKAAIERGNQMELQDKWWASRNKKGK